MKNYRLSWCEPGEGLRYAWHGSRKRAEQEAKRVHADWPDVDPDDLDLEIEIELFPSTKANLRR